MFVEVHRKPWTIPPKTVDDTTENRGRYHRKPWTETVVENPANPATMRVSGIQLIGRM